jgi:hypothetical protein
LYIALMGEEEWQVRRDVWLHGPYGGLDLYDNKGGAGGQWGLKPDPDQTTAVPDFASFHIPLKTYAPPNWNRQAHLAFIMRNAGPTAREKITLRAGK